MKKGTILLTCFLVPSFLFAKKFWEQKPFTEWTREEALSVLMKSPWADDQTFGNAASSLAGVPSAAPDTSDSAGVPGGPLTARSGGANALRQYFVRFQSAAPIRMALARLALLGGKVNAGQAQQFVENFPLQNYVVVAVALSPGQDRAELETLTTEKLKNTTYLLLKRSNVRIYLERYLTPSEAKANEGIFLFPRTKEGKETLTLEEEEVRFLSTLSPKTEINRKFKLKDMVINGKLEI